VTVAWATIALMTAGTVAIKAAGPIALGGRDLPARLAGVVALLAPSLLAALVVVDTFAGDEGTLTVDARAAGLAAAGAALAARLPIVVVVLVAAAVTAVVRAVT
jgi:branched-subunit amino acid transport protein